MSLVYIGAFPPGYGGVTVKNLNLYTAIKKQIEIEKIDLNRIKSGDLKEALRLLTSLLNRRNRFVIGISGRKTRKRFCGVLYCLNRKSMEKSILIVMGGTASRDMAVDKKYRKYVQHYRRIYVETQGMLNELKAAGIENGALYPNCRFKPVRFRISEHLKTESEKPLKCVFFSLIQEEKGADIILKAARILPDTEFFFYGDIDPRFAEKFKQETGELQNVVYMGVFAGAEDDIYTELSRYDILLLPTKWKIEGIPGILVEAKISGLPCIVSDESYNREIIRDGIDGFILRENTEEMLSEAITKLDRDRGLLHKFSYESARSAGHYLMENNLTNIINTLVRGGKIRKCVFFSYISQEKGADVILETAAKYPGIDVAFYGPIAPGYKKEFLETVKNLPDVNYYGVFEGMDDERYEELSKYDILLLPTRWEAEGIPGIIIESRIAGLVPVVSDHNYNKEFVTDGVDGVLLRNKTDPDELARSIVSLSVSRKMYEILRENSLKRVESYTIENSIGRIVEEFVNEP